MISTQSTLRRMRLAIIGFGRLGRACAAAIAANPMFELAGVVQRDSSQRAIRGEDVQAPRVEHLRELKNVHAALICVPTSDVQAVAREVLQAKVNLVECAQVSGQLLLEHWRALDTAVAHHRVKAVVGAGWEPGIFTLLQHAFALLIPKGEGHLSHRPGASLHHTAAIEQIDGVRGALTSEYRSTNGVTQRYVYLEYADGADVAAIERRITADPLFAGEETIVLPVESIAALEQAGHGVVLERRGTGGTGTHHTLLFEGRFDPVSFAANVMLDAAGSLARLGPGAHPYVLTQRNGRSAAAPRAIDHG